jgi:amino acid adenylation domain-containing protein
MRDNPAMVINQPSSLPDLSAGAMGNSPRSCVHHLVEKQALRTPEAVAVELGGRFLTYRELNARAARLALALTERGVTAGDRVAILLERSLTLPVAVLAVFKTGAGYVPLDRAYPAGRLAFMLEDAKPTVIVTDPPGRLLLPPTEAILVDPDEFARDQIARQPPALDPDGGSPESHPFAYLLYTSGSTGRPKGVIMPHGPLINLLEWHRGNLPLKAGERVLQFAPISFDVSFQEIFTTLGEGGTLVLMDEALRRDPEGLLSFLMDQSIHRLFLPFVALQQLAEAAVATGRFPRSLRDVITAGEQLQVGPALRSFFGQLPATRLHNHYGPTETHVATACTLPPNPADWESLPSIGRPIAHTSVYLLDDHRQPVAPGASGEIYLGGACVARGYWGLEEPTASRFLPDPFAPGRRMYRTGDLGCLRPAGELVFLGRNDTQIKIRGHRVEPGEIENLLRTHPAVLDGAVTARPRGEDRLLAAYWIPRPGAATDLTAENLREFLAARLPEPLIPTWYVRLERLPLTPSGKVDRRALPEPPPEAAIGSATGVPPRPGLEATIATVWGEVLGCSGVGAEDNFFAIGGTSLLVARVQRRLREVLDREVPITVLFQHPTIRQLAGHLAGPAPGAAPAAPVARLAERAARQREALARRQAVMRAGKP